MTGRGSCAGAWTYQITVAGAVGPVLRSAFAGLEFETVERCTTIGLREHGGRDLVDLVEVLAAAELTIQDVCVVQRPVVGRLEPDGPVPDADRADLPPRRGIVRRRDPSSTAGSPSR